MALNEWRTQLCRDPTCVTELVINAIRICVSRGASRCPDSCNLTDENQHWKPAVSDNGRQNAADAVEMTRGSGRDHRGALRQLDARMEVASNSGGTKASILWAISRLARLCGLNKKGGG
jgi:chemotaxis protein methyltransferase CheR